MKQNITETYLKATHSLRSTLTTGQQLLVRDNKLTGFAVRITPSTVSFFVETKDKAGKNKRKTLGQYPVLPLTEARTLALSTIKELKTSTVTNQYPTLKPAFSRYLESMNHRPKTVHDYKNIYSNYLSDWADLRVNEINKDMVVGKYVTSCEQSISQSNKAMKLLQAIIRFSGVSDNPVMVLAQRRLKKQLKPKTSYVPLPDLKLLYKGLGKVKRPSVRFYIKLLLHTGLRANEAMQITSSSVATGTLIITETKNHSDHSIPLTQWLTDNLLPFLEDYPDGFKSSDIRKSLVTACQYLPYTVTRHDLRRTFASYASEAGCDYLLIKRALNHSVSDITARYIQTSPKTLSPVFEAVTGLISEHSNN